MFINIYENILWSFTYILNIPIMFNSAYCMYFTKEGLGLTHCLGKWKARKTELPFIQHTYILFCFSWMQVFFYNIWKWPWSKGKGSSIETDILVETTHVYSKASLRIAFEWIAEILGETRKKTELLLSASQ